MTSSGGKCGSFLEKPIDEDHAGTNMVFPQNASIHFIFVGCFKLYNYIKYGIHKNCSKIWSVVGS